MVSSVADPGEADGDLRDAGRWRVRGTGRGGRLRERAVELGRLERLRERAAAGHGEFVLCTGAAGVGKTRLAEELTTIADARGIPVAWAVPPDLNSAPAYSL